MSGFIKTVVRVAMTAAVLGFLAPLASSQDTFVEGFGGGSNQGGWRWGTGNESIVPLNGNPGAYLQDNTLVSFRPTLSSQPEPGSVFTGDYRTRKVTALGVDLITLDKGFAVESNRFVTLALMNDNGTPLNQNDDRGAYFVSDQLMPDAGVPIDAPAGWTAFDFQVDSQSSALPAGWQLLTFGAPTLAWPELMANVDYVQFSAGVPGTIFLIDSWKVGADNARISTATCQPDLGFSGPGTMAIEACGDVLATGGTSLLSLTGAPVSSPIFFPMGTSNLPTPFKGGTLVPVPFLLIVQVASDADGAFSIPLAGGQGPLSLVLQAVAPDGSLPGGLALSNALQLDFLP